MLNIGLDNSIQFIVGLFQQAGQSVDSLEHILLENDFLPINQSRVSHPFVHKNGLNAAIPQRYFKSEIVFTLAFIKFEEGESILNLNKLFNIYLPNYNNVKEQFNSVRGSKASTSFEDYDMDSSRYRSIHITWNLGSTFLNLDGGFGDLEDGFSVAVSIRRK